MKKIKVLHMVQDLKVGGLERIIKNIVTGLNKDTFDVTVWCLSGGGKVFEEIKAAGISVDILNINNYHNPFHVIKLFKKLRSEGFDIVHTHGYFANTCGRLTARMARVPVIIAHIHSIYSLTKRKNRFMDKIVSYITDRIICISDKVKVFIEDEEGIDRKKTIRIYNGIYKDNNTAYNCEDIKKRFGIKGSSFVIGTAASLHKHKGHKYLIESMKEIIKIYPKMLLLIAGKGPLEYELTEDIKRNNLSDNIKLLGEIEDIYSFLSVLDIFILYSSEEEGLGIAMLEAMSMGKPVIGSDIGGIPEVVKDGDTGCLIEPKNSRALAKGIIGLINNREKMKEFGDRGRERYNNIFKADVMVREIEVLYKKILNDKAVRKIV